MDCFVEGCNKKFAFWKVAMDALPQQNGKPSNDVYWHAPWQAMEFNGKKLKASPYKSMRNALRCHLAREHLDQQMWQACVEQPNPNKPKAANKK